MRTEPDLAPVAPSPDPYEGTLYAGTPYATMARRVTAALIDTSLAVVIYLVVLTGAARTFADPLLAVLVPFLFTGLVVFTYYWVLTARTGQTFGKRATGIQVIHTAHPNTPLGYGASALRAFVFGLAYAMPAMHIINLLLMAGDAPENRGIHDHAASTRVIRVGQRIADPHSQRDAQHVAQRDAQTPVAPSDAPTAGDRA